MEITNKDIKTRDTIIFGSYNPDYYMGGVRHFEGMKLKTLQKLIDMGFVDTDDCQNLAPSIAEFVEFMEDTDGYTVGGYVVSDTRDDYRLSIESISRTKPIKTKEELEEFITFARYADEFDTSGYAWWD